MFLSFFRGGQRSGHETMARSKGARFFGTLAERDLDRPKSTDRIAILFCHHPHGFRIQSIEALARVLEIEALLKNMLLL